MVVGYFKVIAQHLPGGTEKNYKNFQLGWPVSELNIKQGYQQLCCNVQ